MTAYDFWNDRERWREGNGQRKKEWIVKYNKSNNMHALNQTIGNSEENKTKHMLQVLWVYAI